MHLSFYRLKHKPFQISTDPSFLWLGEKHEEALATLRYGVLDNKGFLLLTGDVGTGKTTLINALLKTLEANVLVAFIRDPDLSPMDFFNYTAHSFGMDASFTSKTSFLIQFERFLTEANKSNKRVLLIIDEAQRINQVLLEEVRLLSNIEKEDGKLLNIFFVGQLEFNEILLRQENRAIRQRITVNYNISALTEEETELYIRHRLNVAAAPVKARSLLPLQKNRQESQKQQDREPAKEEDEIFTRQALTEIFSFSRGYPRLINIICDRSLLTGFVEESPTITFKHVRECARELTIPQAAARTNIVGNGSDQMMDSPPSHSPKNSLTSTTAQPAKNSENTHQSRNMTMALALLLLLIAGYLGLSKNSMIVPLRESLLHNIQRIYSPTDEKSVAKDTDDSARNRLMHPEAGPGRDGTGPDRKQKESALSDPEPKEKTSAHNVEGELQQVPAAGESAPLVQPVSAGPVKKKNNNSPIPENRKAEEDSAPPANMNPDPPASVSAEMPSAEPEKQPAFQGIHVKSLVTFEKLLIPFPSNSNFPPVDSLSELNNLVSSLLRKPSYKVIVTGFTDSRGYETFNEKLSEFRANTVKSYMVGKGLDPSRIFIRGFGSQYPIASNDTLSGRMLNRRVEIEIER